MSISLSVFVYHYYISV